MNDLSPPLRAVCDLDLAEAREYSGRHEYDGTIQDLSPDGVRKGLACRPDAAVVDIGLPLLDGFEVARRLRAGLGEGVPIIALTADDDAPHRHRAALAGFSDFLAKPADFDDVIRLLGPA